MTSAQSELLPPVNPHHNEAAIAIDAAIAVEILITSLPIYCFEFLPTGASLA